MRSPLSVASWVLAAVVAVSVSAQDPGAKPKKSEVSLKGMKCYSDKIINKAEVGKGGFKIEGGFKLETGSGSRGSEITDFTFPEDQKKQYFEFDFGPAAAGKTIDIVLTAARTTSGIGLEVISLSGAADDDGKLPAEWSLKDGWPVGLYKAHFSCEGNEAGFGGYLVKAKEDRVSPITSKGVKIYSFQNDKSVEKTELTTADNNLLFECETSGANTKGSTVKMHIQIVKKGGINSIVPNSEVEVKEWPLEDTALVYTFELPGEFPVGSYKMVYSVDDETIAAHPFEVTE